MALIDTTNSVDSTIYLKSKFPHNKVGSNYYIQNLQLERNKNWEFRPNLVDIEEEIDKQIEYTEQPPIFSPIDVAIRTVKNEKGKDIGADWADIAFRDLKHYNEIGSRYRFDTSFPDMSIMTEEEKYFNTSVWICINKNPINTGNNCIIRRCNSSIVFGGSPEGDVENITETHTEPVILDNDLKYINMYYNMVTILPQSEWYATMQMNYFTNCIEINDRVIFGGVDLENTSNNAVFKVKAVVKSTSLKTYAKTDSNEVQNIPLVILALDKDTISGKDNLHTRLANQPPIYFTKPVKPTYEYYLELNSIDIGINITNEKAKFESINETYGVYQERILQQETLFYKCSLMFNNRIKNVKVAISAKLEVSDNDKPENYFKLEVLDENIFSITNLKRYIFKPLVVTCSCVNPDDNTTIISQDYEFTLGGFY